MADAVKSLDRFSLYISLYKPSTIGQSTVSSIVKMRTSYCTYVYNTRKGLSGSSFFYRFISSSVYKSYNVYYILLFYFSDANDTSHLITLLNFLDSKATATRPCNLDFEQLTDKLGGHCCSCRGTNPLSYYSRASA